MKNVQSVPYLEPINLNEFDIFKSLTTLQFETVNQNILASFHKRGNTIYHEGSRINGTYLVVRGILKVFKTGFDGKEQIIRFGKKGELIGYSSVISNELASTTTKVIQDAVLVFLPADILSSLLKENAKFSVTLMKRACKELAESNTFLTDLAQKTVRERLAEVLLLLMDTFELDKDNTLQISLTREELANMVGTATESVIRLLSEFKADKLIELNGRKIKLLDIHKLIKVGNVYI